LDNLLQPEKNSCHVLSFGISEDYSFDEEIIRSFSCQVHSFDLNTEAPIFQEIRKEEPKLANSPFLRINDKWIFYKIGISDKNTNDELGALKLGDMVDFKTALKLTQTENKVIDVLKMDVEGAEKRFIASLDMTYACKYIKQFVFETHANFNFTELVKLEECFFLFYRHTRFFTGDIHNTPTGVQTEFQNKNGYRLELKHFGNEINLAEFMFTSGELYFANRNFF
jgi:hypothetical protein